MGPIFSKKEIPNVVKEIPNVVEPNVVEADVVDAIAIDDALIIDDEFHKLKLSEAKLREEIRDLRKIIIVTRQKDSYDEQKYYSDGMEIGKKPRADKPREVKPTIEAYLREWNDYHRRISCRPRVDKSIRF